VSSSATLAFAGTVKLEELDPVGVHNQPWSGPTRDVVWTTHVGPNQTAGPTAWPNRIYANFVAKTR
jgi:hypothetical protein